MLFQIFFLFKLENDQLEMSISAISRCVLINEFVFQYAGYQCEVNPYTHARPLLGV